MEGVGVPEKGRRRASARRRRVRLAALAMLAGGAAWCVTGGSGALGADSLQASATAQPPIVQPGVTLTLAGSGFLPSVPIRFTLCPAAGCESRPGDGAADCQPATVSAQGGFSCTTPVPLDAGSGDWVATAVQSFPYNGQGAGGSCPAPLQSLPAAPVTPPTTADPSPCQRRASAVVTVVPADAPPATPLPADQPTVVTVPPPPTSAALPALTVPATTPPAATPRPAATATAAPRPVAQPRSVAVAAPLRDMLPGLVGIAAGLLLLAVTGVAPLPESQPATPGAAALAAEALHRLIARTTRKSRP